MTEGAAFEVSRATGAAPRISVLIPCYNLGEFLDEAVESVLAQTYQDFEILIVDDGSTDPTTVRLLDRYVRPKTTVFRTSNQKLARARNFLVSKARGEYLCALDADDKLHPQFFERTAAVLDADPSLTFASTHLQMFGAESRVWPDTARWDLPMLLCDDTLITPTLVRRGAVVAAGGYDEQMPHQGDEDWDLWISLVEAGHRGTILPDVLFFYRRRTGSMCDVCTKGQVHLDLVEYLVQKHRGSYQSHWLDVLLWKEQRIGELRRANVALEVELATSLAPTVARRRDELRALRMRLDEICQRHAEHGAARRAGALVDELEHERAAVNAAHAAHQAAAAEVAALRSSASWRVTAPLRALYRLLRRPGQRGNA